MNTPFNGNIDLANPTTIHTIATPQRLIYAKATLNAKFSDPKYADDPGGYDPDKCPPPQNTFGDCGNDGGRLIYDVYYPTDINIDDYKSCPLPAVILFHAGGFYECTNLELPNVKTVCQELAKRGFVAYSVEYRTGILKIQGINAPTTVQQQLAVYRACQDARGAIRSIILRQLNEGTGGIDDPYRINPDKIFVGGFSAGGLIAMNASWYNITMEDAIFQNGGPGSISIAQALGPIDADFYYASKTALKMAQNQRDYQTNIIGNACMWGAIGIPTQYRTSPLNEYDFFDKTLLKPLISFQGRQDQVFPYPVNAGQNIYFAAPSVSNPDPYIYNSTTFCISKPAPNDRFFLDQDPVSPDLITGSTLNMRYILQHYMIADEHYVDCDMTHGFSGKGISFHGDFGTGVANEQDASEYLAKRIATFFQAVLNGIQGNLGTDYFPDCKNGRTKCNPKTTTCTRMDCESQ